MWNRSSLWGVPSSRDACCCLCAGQAASPEKKPGGLLTCFVLYCPLENCRSCSFGVYIGVGVVSAFSFPIFLYSLDIKLVFPYLSVRL